MVAVLLLITIPVPSAAVAFTFTTMVSVAVWPAPNWLLEKITRPVPPTLGFAVTTQPGPLVTAAETKRVPNGIASITRTPRASLGPWLVTVKVYVINPPGATADGEAVALISRSARAVTCVVVQATLSPLSGSLVVLVTVAEFAIGDCGFADEPTWTTTWKMMMSPAGTAAFEKLTVPVLPTAGVPFDHPAGAEAETNVVFAGGVSEMATVCAALGPLLVRVMV
jgi:hypothetical protein